MTENIRSGGSKGAKGHAPKLMTNF